MSLRACRPKGCAHTSRRSLSSWSTSKHRAVLTAREVARKLAHEVGHDDVAAQKNREVTSAVYKGEHVLRPGGKTEGHRGRCKRRGELPSGRVRWKRAPMGTLDAAAANVQGMVRASGAPAEAIGIGGHQQEDQQRPLQQRSLALHSPCFAEDPDEISTRSSSGCP